MHRLIVFLLLTLVSWQTTYAEIKKSTPIGYTSFQSTLSPITAPCDVLHHVTAQITSVADTSLTENHHDDNSHMMLRRHFIQVHEVHVNRIQLKQETFVHSHLTALLDRPPIVV